ncbi:MAG: UDP-N-acetylmuramoyl-L-alanyl-D-glutamate--2,6-diaminopimelate ligase [Desulfobacterales bacterium]
MKLSRLLKSINPIRVYVPGARGAGTSAQNEKDRHLAHRAEQNAETSDAEIGSIHYRAQEVKPDGMFVAIPGSSADGHDFIDEALKRGAAAIVVEKEIYPQASQSDGQANTDTVMIQVSNTRQALANLSAAFYENPSERLVLIGITGTNGKTTTAYLIEGILQQAGYAVGVIGTINYRYAGKTFDNPITTPESLDLQRILAEMLSTGITHVVIEASSHAIDLYRIQCCWLDIAVFTNLSQDHLDFHGDMQAYWASKKRLFTHYLDSGPKKDQAQAVINCDNPYGKELVRLLNIPLVTTGRENGCAIKPAAARCELSGITGTIATPDGTFDFISPLVGEHNVENILCATGVAAALHLLPDTMKSGLEALSHIPGRLERIDNNTGRFVYVDYAHTPDALQNVIHALRNITTQRIICVFGCGGDRDKAKRSMMGEIAAKHCDLSIVTSDNPRTEDPQMIIDHILEGIKRVGGRAYSRSDVKNGFSGNGFVREPDRRRAIKLGIQISKPGDTVLIAGKGHETYQILGKKTVAFDDREEARKALVRLEAGG